MLLCYNYKNDVFSTDFLNRHWCNRALPYMPTRSQTCTHFTKVLTSYDYSNPFTSELSLANYSRHSKRIIAARSCIWPVNCDWHLCNWCSRTCHFTNWCLAALAVFKKSPLRVFTFPSCDIVNHIVKVQRLRQLGLEIHQWQVGAKSIFNRCSEIISLNHRHSKYKVLVSLIPMHSSASIGEGVSGFAVWC